MEEVIEVTQTDLLAAFAEWQRRYRENPGNFQADFGDEAAAEGNAAYFFDLLKAHQAAKAA